MYPAGTELYAQGGQPDDVYLIERGVLKLVRRFQDGQELIVDFRHAGQLSGAASAVVRKPYPVTAVTITRCELRRMPSDIFVPLLKTDPTFLWQILEALSTDIYAQYDHAAELGCCLARQRLEHFFWLLASSSFESTQSKRKVHLQLPVKHWELAEWLAITPSYLSRLLKQLEKEGLLKRKRGWLIISNRTDLWHLA